MLDLHLILNIENRSVNLAYYFTSLRKIRFVKRCKLNQIVLQFATRCCYINAQIEIVEKTFIKLQDLITFIFGTKKNRF